MGGGSIYGKGSCAGSGSSFSLSDSCAYSLTGFKACSGAAFLSAGCFCSVVCLLFYSANNIQNNCISLAVMVNICPGGLVVTLTSVGMS